ncbi:MAG: GIY-YIG nuclease family protein [Bacteroidetes bacterium]|nr:GIY-YIG nuclease family protein [Bacteroidota bacterium]
MEWRVLAHKKGEGSKFTRLYKAFYWAYYERFPTILQAIEREKQLKRWKRQWKLNLTMEFNPEMLDLVDEWY